MRKSNIRSERMDVQVKLYQARQLKKSIDNMPKEQRFDGSIDSIEKTYEALMHNLSGRLQMLNKLIDGAE